jgi:hypothetical protein
MHTDMLACIHIYRGRSRIFQGGVGDWYYGVAESVGHAHKMLQFENWSLIENCYTRNTSNAIK